MIIRGIKPSDIFQMTSFFEDEALINAGADWNMDMFASFVVRPWVNVFVADDNGTIQGYISVSYAEYWIGLARLLDLYVAPEKRETMTGWRLYKHLLTLLKNLNYRRIETVIKATNNTMTRLAVRCKWQLEATLKNYDSDGRTYFLFSKFINGGLK